MPALHRGDGIEVWQTPEQLGEPQPLLFLSLFNFLCSGKFPELPPEPEREEPAQTLSIIYFNFPL